jgi:glycosyltransferase involved in cell wall biosynthesis
MPPASSMKIAIDIRTILPTRSGVGNYVLHLIENLLRVDSGSTYYFISRPENLTFFENLGKQGVPLFTIFSHENHPLGDLWEHFILPLRLKKFGVEIFHGPASLIPFRKENYRVVVTIHDLVAFLFPNTIPLKYGAYMRYLLRYAVRRADRIISVSAHTREDLIRILKVPPEKISVVHEAPTPLFRALDRQWAREQLQTRYGLKKKFIYHLGNIEPRKNLIVLLQAFGQVCRQINNEYVLVLSGQPGWLTGSLQRFLARYPFKERIIFTGYVPREDLPLFMNGAEMFVFPSLYEGFGLPVLEAMHCGTPVISSNRSSIPEIVGPAALLIDPEDPSALAEMIVYLIRHPDQREKMRALGLEQAARFTWEEAALKTLAVYHSLTGSPAGTN